jgi:peptidoglycan/LPS O-acetylase OafA/YrhL
VLVVAALLATRSVTSQRLVDGLTSLGGILRTLADFDARHNSLNFIRLLLAVSVIVSHAWPIGLFGPDPHLGSFSLGSFAVAGFFALSGWLITQSRLSKTLLTYGWHRFCRIYPGYLVALLVTAFVFAPIGAALSSGRYRFREAVAYICHNFALEDRQHTIPGTLPTWAYPAWNGSLWTLLHEVGCYVAIGILVVFLGRRAIELWSVVILLLLTAAAIYLPHFDGHVHGLIRIFVQLAPFFFAGAAIYAMRARIVIRWQYALLAAVVTFCVAIFNLPPVLSAVPAAYALLWMGAVLPAVFQKVGRRNDISYGVYIYAFPVQQLLLLVGATHAGIAPYIVLCVIGTLPLAALSWFAVERPAHRWRHVFDRRSAKDPVAEIGSEGTLPKAGPHGGDPASSQ